MCVGIVLLDVCAVICVFDASLYSDFSAFCLRLSSLESLFVF
jgi:hypothetical protein